MTYLVMEVHRSYAVLLDEDGEFFYAANLDYKVGDRVQNPVLMREPEVESKAKVLPFAAKAAGVSALMIVLAALFFIFIRGGQVDESPPPTIASSIYMTINPEVRLDLDENGQVVEITGLNAEGRDLVETIDLDTNRLEILDSLFTQSVNQDYLQDGGHVQVGLDTDSGHFAQYAEEIEGLLLSLQETIDFTFEIVDLRNPEPVQEEVDAPEEPEPPARQPVEDDDDDDDDDDDEDDDEDDDDEDDDDEDDD